MLCAHTAHPSSTKDHIQQTSGSILDASGPREIKICQGAAAWAYSVSVCLDKKLVSPEVTGLLRHIHNEGINM